VCFNWTQNRESGVSMGGHPSDSEGERIFIKTSERMRHFAKSSECGTVSSNECLLIFISRAELNPFKLLQEATGWLNSIWTNLEINSWTIIMRHIIYSSSKFPAEYQKNVASIWMAIKWLQRISDNFSMLVAFGNGMLFWNNSIAIYSIERRHLPLDLHWTKEHDFQSGFFRNRMITFQQNVKFITRISSHLGISASFVWKLPILVKHPMRTRYISNIYWNVVPFQTVQLLGEIKSMGLILVLLNSCSTAHCKSVNFVLALNELKKAPHPSDSPDSAFSRFFFLALWKEIWWDIVPEFIRASGPHSSCFLQNLESAISTGLSIDLANLSRSCCHFSLVSQLSVFFTNPCLFLLISPLISFFHSSVNLPFGLSGA
jgi:hypothetical protein